MIAPNHFLRRSVHDLHKHLLMHNIGHNDLYLIMKDHEENEMVLLPKDRHMYSIGKKIYVLLESLNINIAPTDRIDTFSFDTPFSTQQLAGEVCLHHHEEVTIPDGAYITGVILPIFIPVFHRMMDSCTQENNSYHITFFTKGGEIDLLQRGSSTEYIGKSLIYIIQNLYPYIRFSQLHDGSEDDFSFKGRPEFFRKQVHPHISRIRREIVNHYAKEDKEKWAQYFFLHLSLNTGTTTVFISTLNALQPYRPDLFHVKHAYKWPDRVMEVEHINQQQLKQSPAVSIEHIDSTVQLFAIRKMQEWRDYFTQTKQIREQDKESPSFFFRKGKQEVLSLVVVRVEGEGKKLIAFRGVNLEVSLPTGSLCAERNAIGSALIHNPNLKRENILCIAILSLGKKGPTIGPCGACQEWLKKVTMVNPDLSILTFEDLECTKVYINSIPAD